MFKSFNVAKLKAGLTYLWIVLMILCLWKN